MTTLEHKKYGALGSEFIVHHCVYRPRRLVMSLLLTSVLASAFQVYEVDDVVLWIMSVCLAGLLVYRLLYKVKQEAVLVLPSVGVEVKTQYLLGGLETHFFDKAHVRGIVINEAVTMHSILSYLAVLLTSGTSAHTQHIFPLFTRSWPGQQDLVYIYRAVQNMQTALPPVSSPPPSSPCLSPPPSLLGGQDQGKGKKQAGEGEVKATSKPDGAKHEEQGAVRRSRRRTRSSQS